MRLDRLDLTAFGPFTGASLDLSRGSQGLHLLYGPNEAGKSSALRAIRQLFSGIPHQSADNFVHPHEKLRIGAALRDKLGSTLELVRRKGSKNTLLRPDGKPLDDADARLARALGGVAPDEFLRKFVLDHRELVEGGREVIQGGGDLGRLLFASGSGLAGLGRVQKSLDDEAEGLFKRGGSRPLINADLARLDDARKAVREGALRSSEWVEHDQALTRHEARKAELERELAEATRGQKRWARLADAVGPVARRAALLDELAALGDVPRLRPNFAFEWRDAFSLLHANETAGAEAVRKAGELSKALAALVVPDGLVERAEAIEALNQQRGVRAQAGQDRARLSADCAALEAQARDLLRDLGRDPTGFDDPAQHRSSDRAAVLDLAASRQALRQARDEARKALDRLDARRASAASALEPIGPDREPLAIALHKAFKAAAPHSGLDDRLADARRTLARDDRRAEAALDALGLWSGPLDALEALAVPPAETIERFRDELDAAAKGIDDLTRSLDALDAEARQTDARVEQLRLGGEVPTEPALADARARRDDAWDRLKLARAWDDALASAFEPALRRADDLADRLRLEAQRVTEHARLLAERSQQAATRVALRARLDAARASSAETVSRWSALWSPLGIKAPDTPREMLAWSRRQAELSAQARATREARDDIGTTADRLDALRLAFSQALVPLGAPAAEPGETLADLIDRAEGVAESVRKESAARNKLVEELEAIDRERPALEEQAAASADEWSRWEARWTAAMSRIGLGPDALPAEANTVLEQSTALADRLTRLREHRSTLDALSADAGRFADDVRALAALVAPDLVPGSRNGHDGRAGFDPLAAAAELSTRLSRAREARKTCDDLAARLAEQKEAAATAREEVAKLRGTLDALRLEARCPSVDDLPAVEERSRRRQQLEGERDALNAQLRTLSAGGSFEAFLTEAALADPDGLASKVDQLNGRIEALGREREGLDQAIGRERTLLGQMDGSPRGADAGQDAEELRSRIRSDVEHYARIRLASAVLRAGIERYRKKSQDPVLARASALFAGLTLGSFEGLRVDYDDRDEPVLQAVRAGGREALGVNALSLGTADQLYLSLRLAAIDTDLDHHEPLPLIVDDVLIQFDDARAAATLRALADLAKRTQVILFTHHEHLRDLASSVVPPDLLFPQTLPSRAPGALATANGDAL